MAAFLIPQQFRNSIFAKHKYTKSMKKVILVDDKNIDNQLDVFASDEKLWVSLGDLQDNVNFAFNTISLTLEDAKTLREMIDDAITEMEQERS